MVGMHCFSSLSPFESEYGGLESERYDNKQMQQPTDVVFGDLQVKIFEEPEQVHMSLGIAFYGIRSSADFLGQAT